MSDILRAGVARRDITPPPGTTLFGYPTVRHGHLVADALNATALALHSAGTTAVIVSLDWCLIDEAEVDAIRDAAAAASDLLPGAITLCCTHTHSGPATQRCWGWGERNNAYLDTVRGHIVAAILEACQTLRPVRVGIGVTATEVGINRREVDEHGNVQLGFNQWGPRDPDLTVIRFESQDGGTPGCLASLVHLSAHPTARGHNADISRDWPGVMMDRVEQLTGAPVVFINGAFGDVAPRTNILGAIGDGAPAAHEVGSRAADDALRAWRGIKDWRTLPLQLAHVDFELPLAALPTTEEATARLAALPAQCEERGANAADRHYYQAVLEARRGEPAITRRYAQTITRLGPIALVPFPGEIFSEIALRLQKASPLAHTLVAGTSNGSNGYLVTREARGRGGYEVWVARAFGVHHFADNIDDALVAQNLALLRRLTAEG